MIPTFEGRTADEAWLAALAAFRGETGDPARPQPSRAGSTQELLHTVLAVAEPRQRWVVSRRPPISPGFAIAEVVWIVRARNDAAFLNFWNPALPRFAGEGETYHGAYGHRLRRALGVDQLERAYAALAADPDSRQVVLQTYHPALDLPDETGRPSSEDIPCNVTSMLKARGGRLHWTQVMRSNDLFRGLPYNIVQFTSLQEVVAGWLGLELGTYVHVSDSLHVYDETARDVHSSYSVEAELNTDSLALPKAASDTAFSELERRAEKLAMSAPTEREWAALSDWPEGPPAFQNLLRVLVAEAARRHGRPEHAAHAMASCTNPVLTQLWERWSGRFGTRERVGASG